MRKGIAGFRAMVSVRNDPIIKGLEEFFHWKKEEGGKERIREELQNRKEDTADSMT